MAQMQQQTFTSSSTGMHALVWSPARDSGLARPILYLHGSGEFGTGLEGLFRYPDFPSLLRDGLEIGCRVAIPACHVGQEWQPALVSAFLDDVDAVHGRPTQGYDLLGYSRGGRGAYQLAAADPDRTRSVAVISARDMPELVPSLCGIPVFICHGLEDQNTPVARVLRMHQALCDAGCNCELNLVDGDHFIIAKV